MLSAFFSSVILLLVSVSSRQLHEIFFWLMGNLSTVDLGLLKAAWGYSAVCFVLIYMLARDLNALSFGEEQARHLGVSVDRVKLFLFVIVSMMVGASVSLSGLIGFVGLVVPHALRLLIGADHRTLIPACAIGGSFFLIIADTISRTVIAPAEIPVGVVTALIGAPFFLYLLRKSRKII
jgi:iron complex transport system permease protein